MRRPGLTGSQRGLGVLGLTSRLGQNRHGAFDPIPDSPKNRKEGLCAQLATASQVGGKIIIWCRSHGIYSVLLD